jgi:hypothetical protein
MSIEVLIALIGVVSGGAMGWLSHQFFVSQKNRQLKENYYQKFLLALHRKMRNNDEDAIEYAESRNTMFIIASSNVVEKLQEYEEKGMGRKTNETHDKYLTELIKAIRKDLKIKNKSFPQTIGFLFLKEWASNSGDKLGHGKIRHCSK